MTYIRNGFQIDVLVYIHVRRIHINETKFTDFNLTWSLWHTLYINALKYNVTIQTEKRTDCALLENKPIWNKTTFFLQYADSWTFGSVSDLNAETMPLIFYH